MTAGLPDRAAGRDALRAALAEALGERLQVRNGMGEHAVVRLADALLPVVEAYAAQKAAETTADLIAYLADLTVGGKPALSGTALRLARARAALSPATEKEKR